MNGIGTLTLTGDNTYTGGTTVTEGELRLGDGGTSGSIVGDVVNNGTLTFIRSDAVSFAGVVSGNGTLVQLGPGALSLTGANTYTGVTTVVRRDAPDQRQSDGGDRCGVGRRGRDAGRHRHDGRRGDGGGRRAFVAGRRARARSPPAASC